MSTSNFPLTVNNSTNEEVIVRYMRNDQAGTAEARLPARGSKCLRDAYMGMTIYASNMYDPSASYASMTVTQYADEIHFDDQSGGYGRGAPVGPPAQTRDVALDASRAKVAARNKEREAEIPVGGGIPGDSADLHGASLSHAYSGDLIHQGGQDNGGGGGGGGEAQELWVPGMGYMNRDNIPEHVMQQIQQREQMQQAQGIQQQRGPGPQFPDYDSQARELQADGQSALPGVKVKSVRAKKDHFGPLTTPELYVAGALCKWCRISRHQAESCARPLFFILIGCAAFGIVYLTKKKPMPRRRI